MSNTIGLHSTLPEKELLYESAAAYFINSKNVTQQILFYIKTKDIRLK